MVVLSSRMSALINRAIAAADGKATLFFGAITVFADCEAHGSPGCARCRADARRQAKAAT